MYLCNSEVFILPFQGTFGKVILMYRCGEYLEKVRSMYLCKSEVFFLPFQGAIRVFTLPFQGAFLR